MFKLNICFHQNIYFYTIAGKNPDSLGNHLNALLQDAENRIHELGTGAEDLPQLPFSTRASFSSIIGKYRIPYTYFYITLTLYIYLFIQKYTSN